MARREVILSVVDPVSESQPALERAIYLAKNLCMHLNLFICDYNANLVAGNFLDKKGFKEAKEQAVNGYLTMLDKLSAKVAEEGVPFTVQAAWDRPLHEGIIRQALHVDARYVLKDTHYHSIISRAVFTNTDWHLIRTCPAPLWLVKPETVFNRPSIMAAVDPLHEHDKPAEFDERILSEACALADSLEGNTQAVHVFNPYLEPEDPKIMKTRHAEALQALTEQFQLSEDRIHLVAGVASDVLPQVALELDVKLVIMGSLTRSRLHNAMVGSTAEKVLDQLSCDVLVIKPKGYLSPVNLKQRPRGYYYEER